jgi:pimeloyl-ACP methyl ester carboxylesterase
MMDMVAETDRTTEKRAAEMTATTQQESPGIEASGSVAHAPGLPPGFTDTFTSHIIDTGGARLHAVAGGAGPALLLVGGWPQNWYAWRLVMPALARDYTVIAIDPRGVGLSERARDGFDTGTLAADLVAAMDALGYPRFAMIGHDVGMWIGYALAADHPDRLTRLAVAEAAIPGISPVAPGFGPAASNDRLWHFGFNRLADLNEALVHGREDIYFGWQFVRKASTPLPKFAVDYYIDLIARDPDALRCSFEFYRAIDQTVEQNERRRGRRLTLPVLAIGGGDGLRDGVAATMRLVADDVQSAVLEHCGHFPAEEAPEALLNVVRPFLAPDAAGR